MEESLGAAALALDGLVGEAQDLLAEAPAAEDQPAEAQPGEALVEEAQQLVAGALALIPFIYLGQHFNREHQRGVEFTLLQIPLGLTLILFPLLYFWSIFDAYQTAILKTAAIHQDDELF